MERLEELESTYDPLCFNNTDRLTELLSEIDLEPSTVDENKTMELKLLVKEVCSENCGGVTYKIFTECGNQSLEYYMVIQDVFRVCNSNTEFLCGLVPLQTQIHPSAISCGIQYFNNTDQCPEGCKGVFDQLINELGCCVNNYYFYVDYWDNFSLGNTTDLYETCELEDPGYCTNYQSDDATTVRAAAAKLILSMAVLVTAVFLF